MTTTPTPEGLEQALQRWRLLPRRIAARDAADVAVLEAGLRRDLAALAGAGLAPDEALLVALVRLGPTDPASAAFARAQLDARRPSPARRVERPTRAAWNDAAVACCLAVLAALAVKAPALFGLRLDQDAGFYARNMGLFLLPLLTGYFLWTRDSEPKTRGWLAAGFGAAAVFANGPALPPGGALEGLIALHLPVALWLAVGIAHAGGRWSEAGRRMDFVRFSGELLLHYVLIALGGGVFMGLMVALFQGIGVEVEPLLQHWVLPCGAAGALLIGAWLVEAKQGAVEGLASMLTRLFTPLFAALLLALLATMAWTGRAPGTPRELLIALDLLLVVVLGLLLYAIAARDPGRPPGAFDRLQVLLVLCALLVDAVALWAIAARISEFGPSPNRVAALGVNLILLVNLAGSALLYLRFLRGRGPFAALERWQTGYLPLYAGWSALVVIAFPWLFGPS
jgi:hypothetical protein